MEAADDFVEQMAWLSYLDECDEAARFNFVGFKKRWAARRAAGLVGKPRPARVRTSDDGSGSDVVMGGRHRSGTFTSAGEMSTSIVPYVPRIFEIKPRKARMGANGGGCAPKAARGAHGHRAPIQQPRKHY